MRPASSSPRPGRSPRTRATPAGTLPTPAPPPARRRGASPRDYVFRNTFSDLYALSELFRAAGTKPEYECYDVGHLYNLRHLADQGLVDFPCHLQFVLGVLGANAAGLEQLLHMHRTAVS